MKKILLTTLTLLSFTSLTCLAQQKGEWDIRLRGIDVVPQESATIGVIGGNVSIDHAIVPELDFTYFFVNNWSAELILGTTRHTVTTVGSNLTAIGGSSSANVNLGKVSLLPPTLTLQYHIPTGSGFKPYIGLGVNYTIFYNVDNGPVVSGVSYQNHFGFATQIGSDFDLSKKVFFNIDVKKIWLSSNVVVNASNLTPASSPQLSPVLATIPAAVKINPWVLGVGFGYRFK
ncbi:OmpW/AlkL family protein [Mucilaginibacter gotjawali]|uniref:Outer membrane protein W n=2 Tax=Mucilaginibacter gotjawali TaxID=1550579 RepID=A0A0X8X0L7_9SPHI|nr:OmpW family outer membrane protein [Mucilaginibacter gotjawali]MBB3056168.1 outer membrane protein [Mucilaginibacter gotjawali]BAU53491.1 Outer membrane protein W precursor [Mucilaginibacter gotjawali]